jgi:cytochrome b subunit of formate dehydrogenase
VPDKPFSIWRHLSDSRVSNSRRGHPNASIATLIPGKIVSGLTKDDDAYQLLDRDGSHARRSSALTFAEEEMMEKRWIWLYVGLVVVMFLWTTTGWILWAHTSGEGWQIYAGAAVLLLMAEGAAVVARGKRLLHLLLLPVVALGSLVGSMVILTVISFMLVGFEGVQ